LLCNLILLSSVDTFYLTSL